MKAALVIMAAGLGSRYGGNKQVDGVGPGGEILMEYSIHDAIRAGFTKIVFIIKNDMQDLMRSLCGDRIAGLTARDGEAGGGMLRRAGLFQSAGLLYRARRAYQALRHHPRRAVRPALCAGAFLRHQR